jgi:glycosyltransferase involved in cell wall biosynthesis
MKTPASCFPIALAKLPTPQPVLPSEGIRTIRRPGGCEPMTAAKRSTMKLSIIIANYNYCEFVGAAIESALAVDWPDKEVIVVDDASTDGSREVIESYGGRVAAYFRPKSHQFGAHAFGFQQSTGDAIIFLDSDDLLEPEVMQEVAKIWQPGASKVQYRMNLIDADGTQLGSAIPQFPPNDCPEKLRRTFLRTMAYTTPPGSGNVYARDFARYAFDMSPSTTWASDDPLLTLAPVWGDVLTIRKPLARYRTHAKNGPSGMDQMEKIRRRLRQDIEKAQLLTTVSQQFGLSVADDLLLYSLHHLQYRIASFLVDPSAHPFPKDSIAGLTYRLISSAAMSSQTRLRDRAILVAWTVVCVLAPSNLRRNLILWRFEAISRPRIIKTLLGALSSLRSPQLPDRAETASPEPAPRYRPAAELLFPGRAVPGARRVPQPPDCGGPGSEQILRGADKPSSLAR